MPRATVLLPLIIQFIEFGIFEYGIRFICGSCGRGTLEFRTDGRLTQLPGHFFPEDIECRFRKAGRNDPLLGGVERLAIGIL